MTNYNLEEFKAWLEAKPERKENLAWRSNFPQISQGFKEFIEGKDTPRSPFGSSFSWQPYRQVFLKWKAEVDQAERERERERERESKMRREEVIW